MTARPIRVLIADDSHAFRSIITDVLEAAGGIEVGGSVANGELALASLRASRFDVVLLDIEMPVMDGLTALPRILQVDPHLKVIMVSTTTETGARETIRALSLGAADFLPKPRTTSREGAFEWLRANLVTKIKALGAAPTVEFRPARSPRPRLSSIRPEVVVIGASTGGPNAIADLLVGIGPAVPGPILVLQHMPALFTRLLAERFRRETGRTSREAMHGEPILPGHTYVAPGDFHLRVGVRAGRNHLLLDREDPENYCRPALDVLVRSVARTYRDRALLVVLTGMGDDGLRGTRELHAAGSRVLIQDRESSVVWGMPGAIHREGLYHGMGTIQELVIEIQKAMSGESTAVGRLD